MTFLRDSKLLAPDLAMGRMLPSSANVAAVYPYGVSIVQYPSWINSMYMVRPKVFTIMCITS